MDLRTKRTKNLLSNALFNLLKVKSFDSIKVIDICNYANIHRTTFYTHFKDKYDLLNFSINRSIDSVFGSLDIKEFNNSVDFFNEIRKKFITKILDNQEFFTQIFLNNNEYILDTMYSLFKNKVSFIVDDDCSKDTIYGIPLDLFSEFCLGGTLQILQYWLKNPNLYSKDELISYFDKIFLSFDDSVYNN